MKKTFFAIFAIVLLGFIVNLNSPAKKLDSKPVQVKKEASISASTQVKPNETKPTEKAQISQDLVLVSRAVDGDTIELSTGQKVRYIGINTPETVDPRKAVQCFGKEASNKNKELVEGKKVRLEKDVSETDKYGRLLRYVYLGDKFINLTLVKEGFAYASSYPPDVKFQEIFRNAQSQARSDGVGLWKECEDGKVLQQSITPSITPNNSDGSCLIKGNIGSSGKIYHLPGQRYYNQTVIDTSIGEKWFCTETEAVNAGWRKSRV